MLVMAPDVECLSLCLEFLWGGVTDGPRVIV